MKRILVCGAGGSPATNFVRSLREMAEPVYLIGVDADPATLERAETDVRYLVPRADSPQYLSILNQIIDEENADFIHAQNDHELTFLSRNRDAVHAKMFLPASETVEICLDKFASYEKWHAAGITVPRTILLNNEADLKQAFIEAGPRVWLRNITGAAGNGSYPTDRYDDAVKWIESHNGWGIFTAAACLTKDTVTWSSIWNNGELIVAQGRKRLSWELSNRSPSGVTGVTGTGVTYGDADLDAIALKAIAAIDSTPHGIFSVDCTYDADGIPNPTEINIGRFFTTHYFFTRAGLNLPEIFVRIAYGEPVPPIAKKYNPLPGGLAWVRGVDFEPVLTTEAAIAKHQQLLDARLQKVT
jgi:carbamoyl-phosphate synthase large subunit